MTRNEIPGLTRNEVIDLLSVAAAFDQRTVGEADITAWGTALHGTRFAAARDAIIAHYREQTRRVMPADIRQHIRLNSRSDAVPFAELESGISDEPNAEYLSARADMIAAMKARDAAAMNPADEATSRTAAWLRSHLRPGKPPGPAADVPAADRWIELPGDPPELRSWLAARRRGEPARTP